MSREDAMLAVRRHATSKIASAEDLMDILTLGFRGEALPSIAAVSRLRVVTRRQYDQAATLLYCEGGGEPRVSDAGAPAGTEIEVADLFFNTPARRKFLRTQATEMNHIQNWITRLGLMRSDVHLRLEHGQRTLVDAAATDELAQRAAILLGREVFDHLHPASHEQEGLRISGLLSDPQHTRSNARNVYLFVNGRYVRDRLLQHALMEGYRTVLPQGRFPVAVLHLQVEPRAVDVNVHPQKTEVRFSDTGFIHRSLTSVVGELLARAPWTAARTYLLDGETALGGARSESSGAARVREAMARYESRSPVSPSRGSRAYPTGKATAQTFVVTGEELPLSQWLLVGTLWNTYLLLCHQDRLVVVDQHAAAERITFERMRASAKAGRVDSQRLLVPVQVEVDGAVLSTLELFSDRLAEVGFEMEAFGPGVVNVKAVPALLNQAPVASLVRDVLDELVDKEQGAPWEDARLEVIGRMACHASVRAGQALAEEEIRSLLKQLEGIDFAGTCPHGRPVLVEFNRTSIERWFLRT
jgi:DNA mismatch repair protein MutL